MKHIRYWFKSFFNRSARSLLRRILAWVIASAIGAGLSFVGINTFVSSSYSPEAIVKRNRLSETSGLVGVVFNTSVDYIEKGWYTLYSSVGLDNIVGELTSPSYSESKNLTKTEWSFDEKSTLSDYYLVIGKSGIAISDFPETGNIAYSELDELGRTQGVKGSLTFQDNVYPSYHKREAFGVKENPSGWGINRKVAIEWKGDNVYHGYFWNRSHLIADSLGGKAIRENAVTGTRTQNVGGTDQKGGMRYSEIKSQKWLEDNHDGVLYYSATPIYQGKELIPRVVLVRVLTSDGTIDESIICYNTANGYIINYNNGNFKEKH